MFSLPSITVLQAVYSSRNKMPKMSSKALYFCISVPLLLCFWPGTSLQSPVAFGPLSLRTSEGSTSYRRPSCVMLDSYKRGICMFASLHLPHGIICCATVFSSTTAYFLFGSAFHIICELDICKISL